MAQPFYAFNGITFIFNILVLLVSGIIAIFRGSIKRIGHLRSLIKKSTIPSKS